MDAAPVLRRRRAVDRRAHERMTEADARADDERIGLLGEVEVLRAETEHRARPPQQPGSPVGSAAASSSRRRVDSGSGSSCASRLSSMRLSQRHRAGQREPAGDLGRAQRAGQLLQRERVAARLGDELVAHPVVDRHRGPRGGTARARRRRQAPRRRAAAGRRTVASTVRIAEHDRDPLGIEAAGDERDAPAPRPRRATARRRRCTAAARSPATSVSSPSTASPTRNGLGAAASRSPNAASSASRCGSGSCSTEPIMWPQSMLQPGVGQLHLGLRRDDALDRGCAPPPAPPMRSSSAVLPTPASPETTSAPLRPRAGPAHQRVELGELTVAPLQRHGLGRGRGRQGGFLWRSGLGESTVLAHCRVVTRVGARGATGV